MSAQRIDGGQIASKSYAEVREGVAELRRRGISPHLVAVQVGENPATNVYIERQKNRFSELGIRYTHLHLDERTSRDDLLVHLEFLNSNPTISGIIVTLPLPEGIAPHEIQEAIAPAKDVEGVHPENLGRLIYNRHAVGPCTALAVLAAIESTGVSLEGKHVVIVGHSDIVGKPVGLSLLQAMATITTCHVATRELAEHTRRADILVVAVGKPKLIRAEMVKEGALVIDVGINRVDGGAIVGDVDFDDVSKVAARITPVPGGIGPITVAMLARNTLHCARGHFAQSASGAGPRAEPAP